MNEPTRYFGGRTVRESTVRKLEARSFRQLVESQIFVPVTFGMTRPDFLAHPDRDRLKDGAYLVASFYGEDESPRGRDHVEGFNMVIIDLDGGREARDFAEAPETLAEALAPLNFVAWQTAKHTPQEPRIKVMVDCVASAPGDYDKAVAHVVSRLGLPPGYKGSSDSAINQPQYRPLHFQGDDYHAVIASRLDGTRLDPAALAMPDPEIDGDVSYAYIPQDGEPSDTGDILSLPVMGLTLEDVRDAVLAIDPDVDYPQWVEIAAAMRHQFTLEEDARQAFELFDEWSSGGSKYRGREDTLAKWRSFRPYPEKRSPITIRTLYHRAGQHGWSHSPLVEKHVEAFRTWCNSNTAHSLMGEGLRRIAGIPVRSEVAEEMMADALVMSLKGSGVKVSKASILKDARRLRKAERMEAARQQSPPWMAPFCFIGPQDRFRNMLTGIEYTVDAFNHTFGRNLVREGEATEDGKAPVLPSNYALNVAEIKVVDRVIYDPREKSGLQPYFERDGMWFCNSFRSASVPAASPVRAKRAKKLVLQLLRANIADRAHRATILDFLAHCVQFPGEKIRWAIMLQGAQGCGKGTLLDTVAASIGAANFKIVTGSALTGDFNDWREGAVIVYIDELFSAGSNRHEVNNKLKDAISNTVIPVNKKFKDLVNIPNVTNYFVTTNKHDALVLEDSDRRYMVLKSLLQTRDEVLGFQSTGVMDEIHDLIRDDPGAFRHFYLNHAISDGFNPNGHAPETEFREELVDQGRNPMLIHISDLIEDPDHPLIGGDVVHYAELEGMTSLLSRNNARPSHYLHMLGYRAYGGGKIHVVDGVRTRIYVHPKRFIEGLDDPVELLEERKNADL